MSPCRRGDKLHPDQEINHDDVVVNLNIMNEADDEDDGAENNENEAAEAVANEINEEEEAENSKTSELESDEDEEAKIAKPKKLVNGYVKMIISVLMPIRTWDCDGFNRLMEMLSGRNVDMDAVKTAITKKYNNMQETLKPMMKSLSQQRQYSLGVELYSSQVEYKLNLDIYINYVSKEAPYEIHSVLFESSHVWLEDMRKLEDWQSKFADFDLSNCSGVILSGHLKQALKGFTALFLPYKIPIIPCLEHLVNRCLNSIFKLRVIRKAIGRLFCHIDKDKEFNPDSLIDCYTNSSWSQLNYFQLYFEKNAHLLQDNCETVPKTEKEFLRDMKGFVDYLFPLKIVLESAVGEQLPSFCSVVKPMLEKVFVLLENKKPELANNKYVQVAYDKFKKNLPPPIMSDNFIMEATFFDRRFDFDLKHVQHIKKTLKEKYKELIAAHEEPNSTMNADNNNNNNKEEASTSSAEKKGLQKFFESINHITNDDISNSNAADSGRNSKMKNVPKSNFDLEFKNYKNEKKLNLDQCPITWWDMHKNQYKILSKIAAHYLTIPFSVNRLFKYEPNSRVDLQNKREMLGEKEPSYYDPEPYPPHEIDGYLWYIHYNQKYFKNITKSTKKKSNESH